MSVKTCAYLVWFMSCLGRRKVTRRGVLSGSGVDLGVGRGYWFRGNGLICSVRDKTFLMP